MENNKKEQGFQYFIQNFQAKKKPFYNGVNGNNKIITYNGIIDKKEKKKR